MSFHGPASEVALESTVVLIPAADFEGSVAEGGYESEHAWRRLAVISNSVGESGAGAAVGFEAAGLSESEEIGGGKIDFSGGADRLVTEGDVL